MSDRTIEKSTAIQKPEIANPGTILSAKRTRSALITSENSPNVTILIGSVRRISIGFINRFKTANTTASTKAPTSVTSTPGRRYAAINIAIVDTSQCVIFMVSLVYTK